MTARPSAATIESSQYATPAANVGPWQVLADLIILGIANKVIVGSQQRQDRPGRYPG